MAVLELLRFGGPIVFNPHIKRGPRAVVFLDGIQSSGITPGGTIEALLESYGDYTAVRYPTAFGFGAAKVSRQILDHVRPYSTVVFVGLSLGGLVAYDVVALARQQGLKIDFRLLLLSTPTGPADVKNPLLKVAPFVPPVWLPETVRKNLLFRGPKPICDICLTEDERDDLEDHEKYSRAYPFAPWIRQAAYIARHHGPKAEVLRGVQAVYLHTPRDPFIRARALLGWTHAYPNGRLPEVTVPLEGTHCTLVAQPRIWSDALRHGFGHLGLDPVAT